MVSDVLLPTLSQTARKGWGTLGWNGADKKRGLHRSFDGSRSRANDSTSSG